MNTGRAPDQGTEYETVTEVPAAGPVPMVTHPGWAERFPHLRQGTTVRRLPVVGRTKADAESGHEWASESRAGPDFDMGLFSSGERRDVEERWNLLARSTGFDRVVHGRQIHATQVAVHTSVPTGRSIVDACDGHATDQAGTLLTVATADCVPVFLANADGTAIALLHAGWRGTAAGVLEEGLARLLEITAGPAADLHAHMGPAICGSCYEVGPEVHEALDQAVPQEPCPIDLRRVLAQRALAAGVGRVSVSSLCTRCNVGLLFSHRAGDSGRQVAVLGIGSP